MPPPPPPPQCHLSVRPRRRSEGRPMGVSRGRATSGAGSAVRQVTASLSTSARKTSPRGAATASGAPAAAAATATTAARFASGKRLLKGAAPRARVSGKRRHAVGGYTGAARASVVSTAMGGATATTARFARARALARSPTQALLSYPLSRTRAAVAAHAAARTTRLSLGSRNDSAIVWGGGGGSRF